MPDHLLSRSRLATAGPFPDPSRSPEPPILPPDPVDEPPDMPDEGPDLPPLPDDDPSRDPRREPFPDPEPINDPDWPRNDPLRQRGESISARSGMRFA